MWHHKSWWRIKIVVVVVVVVVVETSLDAFKAKDTRFVVDWLKSKG